MNYLIRVQIVHSVSDLLRPVHHLTGLKKLFILKTAQMSVQLPIGTVLHDNAKELVAVERDALELHQIGMIEPH